MEPPERDQIALAQRLRPSTDVVPIARGGPADAHAEGEKQLFFVMDPVERSAHTITSTLAFISENAYWYADDALGLSREDLQKAAEAFERDVRPLMLELFGDVPSPGVDGDPHLAVLNTELNGIAGYFGSQDLYPRAVHPLSNEREMFYMDAVTLVPGSADYMSVLVHELQHAIHAAADLGEDSWVNEGLSEVANGLAGGEPSFVDSFLRQPDTQLNRWPGGLRNTAPHYGAATLFMEYLFHHYGGPGALRRLVEEPLDGVEGVAAFLYPLGTTFENVFRDWVVANYLDDAEGPFGYGGRGHRIAKVDISTDYGVREKVQSQLSAVYTVVRLKEGDALLRFEGETEVRRFGADCHSGDLCWWGNRGDSIDSTLTRAFDLTDLSAATLRFWTWFDIEEEWDYAYIEASTDGGRTWDILETERSSAANPIGNSYGPGFTGESGGWSFETADLTPYTGGGVLVRFEYVTDEGVHLDGFAIDDIEVRELGFFDDAEGDLGWEARGFLRTDNTLAQRFLVQLIERSPGKDDVVRQMVLDDRNTGTLRVDGFGVDITNAVVIVSPFTYNTGRPARYSLSVEPAIPSE